jgi:ubiquinone/menaquinone biosynthesis C-methylase UbiE
VPDIHAAAQQGFSQGAAAYARGRPDYPRTLLPWLASELGLRPGVDVLDLGAGTGKFTRLLCDSGARVLALEPVDAMRAELTAALPAVHALAGTAEAIPLANASVEAVVCAQSFHWFANAAALAEIHRVLKPRGRLGLVWNVRDETVDWVAALTELMRPYEHGAPRFRSGEWRRALAAAAFGELHESSFAYQHAGSAQTVIIDRTLSVSFIAALPAAARAEVAAHLTALIDAHPELNQARIAFPYCTQAFWCQAR